MNAERLHALAEALLSEFRTAELGAEFDRLVQGLEGLVQQPQQAQHQEQVTEVRQALRRELENAPSNDFSPAWRQHLTELEIESLLGRELLLHVEEIIADNQMTPATAIEQLTPIRDSVKELETALADLTDGMSGLGIGKERLEPGEFEIGFLIPRDEVRNELGQLGQEFVELRRVLLPLVELATRSRPDLEVRSISSSDFGAFIDVLPAAAACITFALDRIVSLYKKILEVRKLHADLKKQELSDDLLDQISEEVTVKMQQGLDELLEDLRDEFGDDFGDRARLNELMNDVRRSLDALATRIDRSYDIEVHHEPLPPAEEDDATDEEAASREAARQYGEMVIARLPNIQFMNLTGSSILSLPDPRSAEEDLPSEDSSTQES